MKVRRPFRPFDLVEVVWDDASDLAPGWTEKADDAEPHLCSSGGYLIEDTPDHVVLALDSDPFGQHNGRGRIPRGMVKRITVVRKKDTPKP